MCRNKQLNTILGFCSLARFIEEIEAKTIFFCCCCFCFNLMPISRKNIWLFYTILKLKLLENRTSFIKSTECTSQLSRVLFSQLLGLFAAFFNVFPQRDNSCTGISLGSKSPTLNHPPSDNKASFVLRDIIAVNSPRLQTII